MQYALLQLQLGGVEGPATRAASPGTSGGAGAAATANGSDVTLGAPGRAALCELYEAVVVKEVAADGFRW